MNTRKQEPRLKTPPLRRMLLERKVTSLKEYCQHLPSHATNDQISEIESGYMLAAYRNPHHDSYSWHICARVSSSLNGDVGEQQNGHGHGGGLGPAWLSLPLGSVHPSL